MTDGADDIEVALRRLDRPIQSERSAERRRLMLDEFDRAQTYGVGVSADQPMLFASSDETTDTARRRKFAWVTLPAAALLLVVALALVTRPSDAPIPSEATLPRSSVPAPDPVGERVRRFCSTELLGVGAALERYATGDLGGGGNVAPLKDAVVGPLTALVDDLTELGAPPLSVVRLRADLATLENTYLQMQVTTQVAEIYDQLDSLFNSGALSGAEACDSDALIIP